VTPSAEPRRMQQRLPGSGIHVGRDVGCAGRAGRGMLGVASLFGISLHSGSSAITRMQAVNLATDLADRIRANRRAGNAYGGAAATTPARDGRRQLQSRTDGCRRPVPLAAAALADNRGRCGDRHGRLHGRNASTYTITVNWNERAGTQVVTLPYQLQIQVPTS